MFATGFGVSLTFGIGNEFVDDQVARKPVRASYAQACQHDAPPPEPKKTRGPVCPVHDRGFYHSPDVYEDEAGRIWRRKVPTPKAKPAPKIEQPSKPQPIAKKMSSSWVTLPDVPDDIEGRKTPELSSSPGTDSTSGSPKQKSSAKF